MHSLHPLHLLGFPLIFAALSLTMAEQDSEEVGYQDNEWYEDLDQDQDEEKIADGGDSPEKREWMKIWDEARQFLGNELPKVCHGTDDANWKKECKLLMDIFNIKHT